MAVDKLVDSTQLDADLTSIANAIRTKGNTNSNLEFPSGFVSAIGNLSSYDFRGANATEVTSITLDDVDYTLNDTSLSSITPSTSTQTIRALTQIPSSTYYCGMGKDHYVRQLQIIDLAYNEEVYPRMLYLIRVCHLLIGARPDSLSGLENDTRERAGYNTIINEMMVYKNSSNIETVTFSPGQYTAINIGNGSINTTNETSSVGFGFKIRIPPITARIDSGIMESSAYQALDYTNSKIHVETKLYKVDVGNLYTATNLTLAQEYRNFIATKQS